MCHAWLFAVTLLCVTVGSPVPTAADQPSALELVDEAARQRREGDVEGSIATLTRAAALTRDARLLARIHFALGLTFGTDRRAEAAAAFKQALGWDPTVRADFNRHKPELVELFRGVLLSLRGTLVVRVRPEAPMTVLLDERPIGPAPLRVPVSIGRHLLEVRDGAGSLAYRKEITVAADRSLEVTIAGRSASPVGVTPGAEPPRRPRAGFWQRRRRWTWVAAGATVVALGVATGFGVAARRSLEQANDRKAALSDPWAVHDDVAIRDLVGDLDRQQLVANISFAAAAGLGVVSVLTLLLEGRGGSGPHGPGVRAGWSPLLVPTGGGMTVTLEY